MSRELFVDTGAWLAILDPRDKYHQVAVTFYREALAHYSRLLLTNLVVAETYINVLRNAGYHKALSFLDIVEQSSAVQCVWSDQKLEARARDILRRYDNQDFSYADAVSFALMQQRELTDAFAFDHHFSVVGFVQFPAGQ
ncbi:MAG: type II toxin-antitoxin system VapC family toxin [Anaerolineae bacterium]